MTSTRSSIFEPAWNSTTSLFKFVVLSLTDTIIRRETDSQTKDKSVTSDTISKRCLLAGVVVVAFLMRILAFSGYTDGDDGQYLSQAIQIADGRYEVASGHWGARIGVYLPVAVLFKTFGTHLVCAAAVPCFFSLSSVLLAFLIGKEVYNDEQVGLLGAALVAFFPLDVIMASQLFPAMGLAALTSISFLAFLLAERKGNSLLFLAAGVALGLAYLHKITALYLLLPFVIYVAYCRRWKGGYAFVVAGLLGVILMESIVFWYVYGNPFHRFQIITSVAGADPEKYWSYNPRPGGKLLSPLVSLVTNQEYGLFYVFIVWATSRLLIIRDKPSRPLLLFFISVGLYTLWGPVSLNGYQNAEPWPRYMSIVTIPAILLLARWFLLCVGQTWRRLLLMLLCVSSLACIYLDTTRTHRSIGRKLLAFQNDNPEKTLVLDGAGYMFLFVENDLRTPANVELLSRGSGNAKSICPSLFVHEDETDLSDCFVAVRLTRLDPVPGTWRQVRVVLRDQRWFAERMRSWEGIFKLLAEKLSPRQGYVIHYAPSVGGPAPPPGS